jgi:hypothetical protein
MNNYEQSKKARRVASITYLIIMAFILGGTYLSNQQKESAKKELTKLQEMPSGFSKNPDQ